VEGTPYFLRAIVIGRWPTWRHPVMCRLRITGL